MPRSSTRPAVAKKNGNGKPPRNLEAEIDALAARVTGVEARLQAQARELHDQIADISTNMGFSLQYMRVFAERLGLDEKLAKINEQVAEHLKARRARLENQ